MYLGTCRWVCTTLMSLHPRIHAMCWLMSCPHVCRIGWYPFMTEISRLASLSMELIGAYRWV
ncbi:hypothetical protein BAB74_03650 [Mycobacteroides abscessus]|nr:hypothetical protein A3N97_03945 [Mycobacteroides abscessus]ANN97931.1 hypothetical protein BAB74_03650 [Mycobacteroides abscessus]TKV38363.1 hypothetical protein CFA71_15130 [Mycobacteroides abscessus subsp. bolletii]